MDGGILGALYNITFRSFDFGVGGSLMIPLLSFYVEE